MYSSVFIFLRDYSPLEYFVFFLCFFLHSECCALLQRHLTSKQNKTKQNYISKLNFHQTRDNSMLRPEIFPIDSSHVFYREYQVFRSCRCIRPHSFTLFYLSVHPNADTTNLKSSINSGYEWPPRDGKKEFHS